MNPICAVFSCTNNATHKHWCDDHFDPRKCTAKSKKRPGEQCGAYPVHGLTVCLRHGGASQKARAAGKRNVQQGQLQRLTRRLGTPIDVEPAQALLDLVASKAGEVEWLRHQVEQLEHEGDLWWGETKVVAKDNPEFGAQFDRTEEARQHIVYAMLHKAQDQLARYASEALKAGVEERQVRVAERTGEQFQTVLTSLLTVIQATPEQMQTAAVEIPRILRNLSGAK